MIHELPGVTYTGISGTVYTVTVDDSSGTACIFDGVPCPFDRIAEYNKLSQEDTLALVLKYNITYLSDNNA